MCICSQYSVVRGRRVEVGPEKVDATLVNLRRKAKQVYAGKTVTLAREIPIAIVANTPPNVGLSVESLSDVRRTKDHERMFAQNASNALGRGNNIDKDDPFLPDARLEELAYREQRAAACGEHGVEDEDVALGDVCGELCDEELGLGGRLVALDEDFSDAHVAAARAQRSLERLARADDRDADYLAREGHACEERVVDGRRHSQRLDGQVVEGELGDEAVQAVCVEDPVGARRGLCGDCGWRRWMTVLEN